MNWLVAAQVFGSIVGGWLVVAVLINAMIWVHDTFDSELAPILLLCFVVAVGASLAAGLTG